MTRIPIGLALAAAAWAAPLFAQPLEVARVGYILGTLEQRSESEAWGSAREGSVVRIGDRFRTGPESRAQLDFGWMSVAIDAGSVLSLPDAPVLSAELEEGRVEPFSARGSIIKVVTPEASVRGEGRVAVRRSGGRTRVSVLEGRFAVEPPHRVAISLRAGQGLILSASDAGPILDLAAPPEWLRPWTDPAYFRIGEPVRLSWRGEAPAYRVELLSQDGAEVVLGRDVSATSTSFEVPWLGTFRWRVSALDAQGLEGMPSEPGSLCVVER